MTQTNRYKNRGKQDNRSVNFNNSSQAVEFVDTLDPKLCRLKIGKELFTAAGPNVETMIKKNLMCFLI